MLRKANKPVFVVANKADNYKLSDNIYEFHRLGFQRLYGISAMNGSGTGELLDDVVKELPDNDITDKLKEIPEGYPLFPKLPL